MTLNAFNVKVKVTTADPLRSGSRPCHCWYFVE